MKKNTFGKTVLLIMIFCTFSLNYFAQNVPENTRLFQLNAKKGSRLSIVENTDNYVYHIGTNNSSDIKFGNLSLNNKGFDDLFILKSKIQDGSHVWLKAIDAGVDGKINPTFAKVDINENIIVFGNFIGSIKVGNKTITSTSNKDAFILKINADGIPQWINYLPNGDNIKSKTSYTDDGTDAFLVYNKTNLLRINPTDGNIIYSKTFPNLELKSIGLHNNNLYVGGTVIAAGSLGNQSFTEKNTAFLVKGNKDADFTSSLKASNVISDGSSYTSDVNDIAFTEDGNILLSGFTTGGINLISNNSQSTTYTYNPNTGKMGVLLYHYIAKLSDNLDFIDFFRTSSNILHGGLILNNENVNSKITIDQDKDYTVSILVKTTFQENSVLFNANASNTYFNTENHSKISILLKCKNDGSSKNDGNLFAFDNFINASSSYYTIIDKPNNNVRTFASNIYRLVDNSLITEIKKENTNGGSISSPFQKSLYTEKNDTFISNKIGGNINLFGSVLNQADTSFSKYFARLGIDGLAKWKIIIDNISKDDYGVNFYYDKTVTDKEDNIYTVFETMDYNASITDALGSKIILGSNTGEYNNFLVKFSKDGKYLWSKKISRGTKQMMSVSPYVDNLGNVFLVGNTPFSFRIDDQPINVEKPNLFIVKLDTNGVFQSKKTYNYSDNLSFIPVFDEQNVMYVFTGYYGSEGIENYNYKFDNISIPASRFYQDFLMLKFDNNLNAIWGKNFYANVPAADTKTSAIPIFAIYDGKDFAMIGNYYNEYDDTEFVGLDREILPKIYSGYNSSATFIAKVDVLGNVVWQKKIESNNDASNPFTTIGSDSQKNIYAYFASKDKVNINNIEYQYDSTKGSTAVIKLKPNGDLSYHKIIDKGLNSTSIDVIDEDKLLIAGFTSENNLLNYPLNNQGSNFYVATLGKLDAKYLTPMENYLTLTNAEISNDPTIVNAFNFDLINNVSWTAVSDQNWLSLSFTNLTNGKGATNTISGNGDAKITLTAQVNNTGVTRNASVLVSGDQNVTSKTVIVTQSGILANNEVKTFVTAIYPNPTSDILNIQTEQKISKIEIFDMSGKLVKTQMNGDKKIDISKLLKGSYLINIVTDQTILKSKFIKN